MVEQPFKTKEAWIEYFSAVDMPILRQTARRLEEVRQNIDQVSGRHIASIVLQDPLLAIKVLGYIQRFQGKYLHSDITTIANAIMMIGIEPFFAHFESLATIEERLKDEPRALLGVLHVIRRVQQASRYAQKWAFERHDMNIEEVELAALLHDLAEILLWCFAPKLAIEIRRRQQADPALRSATAQMQVLGIRLFDLQLALCDAWRLPELLKTLMDDVNAELPRVRNVVLAVNLARHSANDWNNPALPDDFAAIENLLHIDRQTLLARLNVPDDIAVKYLSEDRRQ
ncbi:MAG: HDOD domain-containing protein [Candidatus Accumulibacter sp.]|jgi:HD-like signal output (HDOD) protein|nr:HDOD domain-containing protein [Accumulibacter sp.]